MARDGEDLVQHAVHAVAHHGVVLLGLDVDIGGTTGHALALLVGYYSPLTLTLGGGQDLLVDVLDPAGELLLQSAVAGPVAAFDIPVPADASLAGVEVATQALHFGGGLPFALSNAQDLFLGH